MPSNAELTKDIDELAAELGVQAPTEGLNNAKLADLLSNLRAQKADKAANAGTPSLPPPADGNAPPTDGAPGLPPPESTDEQVLAAQAAAERAAQIEAEETARAAEAEALAKAAEGKPFYVAPGSSITSKRGVLDGATADEVSAKDFEGGEETLRDLVDKGFVIDSSKAKW